ncbi:hypothetical protein [Bacillus thuringiensis]|uniref:hypothetical protein n=1 Tax=Bacillus thuringiensis TaxID=1428 RepID=UPI001D0B66F3|nr:hypothetical protein [Bacillus thuringiensis]
MEVFLFLRMRVSTLERGIAQLENNELDIEEMRQWGKDRKVEADFVIAVTDREYLHEKLLIVYRKELAQWESGLKRL